MIAKGTQQYTAAQELANKLQRVASYERWNNNTMFRLCYDDMAIFICDLTKIQGFASDVAKTIESKMHPYEFKIAQMSSKQAWILACAAIENNITFNY